MKTANKSLSDQHSMPVAKYSKAVHNSNLFKYKWFNNIVLRTRFTI